MKLFTKCRFCKKRRLIIKEWDVKLLPKKIPVISDEMCRECLKKLKAKQLIK